MRRCLFSPTFARGLLAWVWLSFGLAASALAAPVWDAPAEVSQGRAFLINGTSNEPFAGSILWQDREIPLIPRETGGKWEASLLLGVPLDAEGSLPVLIKSGGIQQTVPIKILPVPWKEQHITVEPRYVAPPEDVRAQIAREAELGRKLLAAIRAGQDWRMPFVRPVQGTVSSSFGGRRVFNGEPRAPHRGTDLRGPAGTPIKAVADGVVVLAGPQYFSGNVVYLDHGQGIISIYAHLSAFDVKAGDLVEQGQVIGKVGATGRVTGPHLHLGLMIQGVAVDAMPFFEPALNPVGGPTQEAAPAPPPRDG